ncbi:MAG: ferrous iron transport protein A [Oscillospiraceae bacterium]|nr:ferrous iron transport protein A [Oscillospiraceae bacterium]
MLPITMATPGEIVTVKKITGRDEVRQHLGELGFVPDEEVSVVADNGGNLIIAIKSGRVALDKTMANRIFVEEER